MNNNKRVYAKSKGATEIIAYLMDELGGTKIEKESLDRFSLVFLENAERNIQAYMQSHNLIIEEGDLALTFIQIPKNEKTLPYFVNENLYDQTIRVIVENNTSYIQADSERLNLELLIMKGIPQNDIDNETADYRSFLFYLKQLEVLEKQ